MQKKLEYFRIGVVGAWLVCNLGLFALAPTFYGEVIWSFYPYILTLNVLFVLPVVLLCIYRYTKVSLLTVATATLCVFICTAISLAPWFTAGASRGTETELKIYVANVLWSNTDTSDVVEQIKKIDPDVVMIIEFYPKNHKELADYLNQAYAHVGGDPERKGVSFAGIKIFSKHQILAGGSPLSDYRGYTPAVIRINDERTLELLGVHTAAPINSKFLKLRQSHLKDIGAALENRLLPIVAIGDFNATPWTSGLQDLMDLEASGISMASKGNLFDFSWSSGIVMAQIDHAFVSSQLTVSQFEYYDIKGSDHKAMLLELSF